MKTLVIGDLHLTDRPQDEYRWRVFDWARRLVEQYMVKNVVVLGDVLDKKDNHSNALINRTVGALLAFRGDAVLHIIKGNHDYIDPSWPNLGFMQNILGVEYYSHADHVGFDDKTGVWMIPHGCVPDKVKADVGFTHVTIEGCDVNGFDLHGVKADVFAKAAPLWINGDVHCPQTIKKGKSKFVYVGTPHAINFGETWDSCLSIYDHATKKIKTIKPSRFEEVRKHSLELRASDRIAEDLCELDIMMYDQAKVKLHVSRKDIELWPEYRQTIVDWFEEQEAILASLTLVQDEDVAKKEKPSTSVTQADAFDRYVKRKKVDKKTKSAGKAILSDV